METKQGICFTYFIIPPQEKQLYYEPNHGTYYYYDPETSSYLFHSQVDLSQYGSNYPSPYPQPPLQVGQARRTSPDGNNRKDEQVCMNK